MSGATSLFSAKERRAVTMVQPALGPSLGVAPCVEDLEEFMESEN